MIAAIVLLIIYQQDRKLKSTENLNQIPGDMVVNAMIASIAAHSNQHSQFIYQVSSSVRNPVKYSTLLQSGYQYFKKNPRTTSDGKTIKTTTIHVMKTMSDFKRYMFLRYRLPLEVCNLFTSSFVFFQQKCIKLLKIFQK